METINLTPHAVRILRADNQLALELPASGSVARCAVESTLVCQSDEGFPITSIKLGLVVGLPPEQPGTWLVVSSLVRTALPGRLDLFSPGDLVRDWAGQPVGCVGLVSNL